MPWLRYHVRVEREKFFVGSSYNLSANAIGISTASRGRKFSTFASKCHNDATISNDYVYYGCCGRGSTEDCNEQHRHGVKLDYMPGVIRQG